MSPLRSSAPSLAPIGRACYRGCGRAPRRGAGAGALAALADKEGGVVVVVGGGIIGLSTTQQLLRKGYRVTNVSKSTDPSSTTSSVAAGFVFPYLLQPIRRCEEWVKETLEHCKQPPNPDLIKPMLAYVLHIEHRLEEVPEWDGCGLEYRRMDDKELEDFNNARRDFFPAVDGYIVETYCFNTGAYLDWLVDDVRLLGGTLLPRTLTSLQDITLDQEAYGGPVVAIVNCTGAYARNFVGDEEVRPIFGQVVSLAPQNGVNTAYVVEDGVERMGGHSYIFPRCASPASTWM